MKFVICLKYCFANLGLMILFSISCLPVSHCTLIPQNFSFLFHIPCVLSSTLVLYGISFNPVSPFLASWPLLTTSTSTTHALIQYSEAGICEREKTLRNCLSEPSLTSFSSHFHNAISLGTEYNSSVYETTFSWAVHHLVVISTDYFFLLLCPCQQPIFTQGFLCPPQTSTHFVSPSSSQSAPYCHVFGLAAVAVFMISVTTSIVRRQYLPVLLILRQWQSFSSLLCSPSYSDWAGVEFRKIYFAFPWQLRTPCTFSTIHTIGICSFEIFETFSLT